VPGWAVRLREYLGPDPLIDAVRTFVAFYPASPRLTLLALGLGTCSGLLGPAFMLATGALIQAVRDGTAYVVPLSFVAAIFALQRVVDPIREELGNAIWPRVDQWLGNRIMGAVSRPPGLQEIEDPTVLDRIAQAQGAVTGFTPGQAAQQFTSLWSARVQALAALAIVLYWYWWAGLVLLGAYLVAFNLSRRHYREVTLVVYGQTPRLRRSYYLRGLALSSSVAKETRIFDLKDWLVTRYQDHSLGVLHDIWAKRDEGWLAACVCMASIAGIEALTLGVLSVDTLAGRIALGTAVIVAQAMLSAGTLSRYEDGEFMLAYAASSLSKVAELEESTSTIESVTSGSRSADGMPRRHIRFENVSFTYPGRAQPVLDGFNLEIAVGHSLAIVGENGAGKTTLIKLLTRLYDPTAGRITADGVDLRDLSPESWHARISALFQDYARFETPAYDNVAFGALHAWDDDAGVKRSAADAGVQHVIERLPDGWNTRLSREFRNGGELSGGEWQRLALARALFGVASGAGILILDEPTASMDVRGEAEVYQRFLELTRGVTTIVISHRFSTVRRADRIVVVENGRVVEDGTHDELVALADGRYATMYGLQASRFAPTELADA
jgi:ABC-type multidrug transport system fused ATPase/permease subunit